MPARSSSSAVKRLAGNPGKRPVLDQVATPSGPLGHPPAWLSPDGLEEWRRIVPEMERFGIFTSADFSAVVGHCVAYSDVVQAAKRHEQVKSTALTALRLSAAELGLTPASRVKLVAAPAPGHDQAEEFFAQAAPRRAA